MGFAAAWSPQISGSAPSDGAASPNRLEARAHARQDLLRENRIIDRSGQYQRADRRCEEMDGVVAGVAEDVSLDAVEDKKTGLVYIARVAQVADADTAAAGAAEIKTVDKRLIEFLLSPLLRYADESFRER